MEKNNTLVLDVEESPKKWSQWLILAFQHLLAALVATITVPLLTGLPIAATLISAGIGTLFYIIITKMKSPVFLSSSFAYIVPIQTALTVGLVNNASGNNYLGVILGMIMVGLIYCAIALAVKFLGAKWINKILPPIIVGPIIMVIGLSLAGSAVNNLSNTAGDITVLVGSQMVQVTNYNLLHILCGLVAMVVTALCAHYGKKKFISLIPFVVGMGSGYLLALLLTIFGFTLGKNEYFNIISFEPFKEIFGEGNLGFASFLNYKVFVPNDAESFIFLRFDEIKQFDWSKIGEIALLFVPVALVTTCEHIGDHENLGNILGRDLLNGEPGMHRTLTGDGVATAISGCLSGVANTTYGENVAVIGTTRIASVKVVLAAALLTIISGFITPFTALLKTIPGCVTGGVSLILYGFIASSGVKMLLAEKIDFNKSKNIFIASVILVAGIGGLTLKFGSATNPTITITSTAVAMLLGILLNLILVEKEEKQETTENVENQ